MLQENGVTLSDIQKVKAMGFNAIRLAIYWGLFEPNNEYLNSIDQSYFTTAKSPLQAGIDTVVNWAAQNNMYVILTLGWSEYYPPPTWAFPGITDSGQMNTGLISGSSARERTGYINLWQCIANHYSNTANVIFEFMNEPWVYDKTLAGTAYQTFNGQIISAMESVETQSHLKIIPLLFDSGWTEILDEAVDVNKPNVLWSSHPYYPATGWNPNGSAYIDQSFTWNGQVIPQGWGTQTQYLAYRLIRLANKIHSWNQPWITTEFGKPVTQTAWDVWFKTELQVEADNNITGWALFCYTHDPNKDPGYNICNPTTGQQIMTVISPYMVQP